MKSNVKSSAKSRKVNTAVRYDDAQRKAIGKFMRSNTNMATKRKFGCSAHFAGALRRELKIKLVDYVPSTKGKSLL